MSPGGLCPLRGSEMLVTFGSFKVSIISHIICTGRLSHNCILFSSLLTPLGYLASNNQLLLAEPENRKISAGLMAPALESLVPGSFAKPPAR